MIHLLSDSSPQSYRVLKKGCLTHRAVLRGILLLLLYDVLLLQTHQGFADAVL